MESLLIVLNDMPYRTDRDFNALRLADKAVGAGIKVVVFLMGDSVYVARKGQRPPDGFLSLEEMVVNLMTKDAEFKLCATCVNARDFEPKENEVSSFFVGSKADGRLTLADMVSGARLSSMAELISLIDGSEKVVSF